MPSKDPALSAPQRIRDILDNIDAIRTFTTGMDFARFESNKLRPATHAISANTG